MNKKLWYEAFSREDVPSFPCPHCQQTTLELQKDTLEVHEPTYSVKGHSDPDWEPDWSIKRFIVLLKCTKSSCGEFVSIAGDIIVEPGYDNDGSWSYKEMLRPRNMFPAPHIIALPEGIPGPVETELMLAFQLFWSDYGSCATKLRTSVERLMDHFKVVKIYVAKDPKKPTKAGKIRLYDLAVRIDKFISTTGDVVHKDHLHALRMVGNVGTHKNEVTRDEILDAFEVYEHALSELIAKKSAQIAKKPRNLPRPWGKRRRTTFRFRARASERFWNGSDRVGLTTK